RSHETFPSVWLQLFYRKRHAPILSVHAGDNSVDLLSLLEQFAWMDNPLRPGNIRDVHQAVNAVFDFDESAKVSQVANAAMHARSHLKAFMKSLPWVCLDLLHAQTDTARLCV